MIIIVKQNTPKEKVGELLHSLEEQNFKTHLSEGENTTIIGLVGDTSIVDIDSLKARDIVEDVRRVSEPYKKANRKFHADDTVVDVLGQKIGGGHFAVMAGPCSVESESQILEIAKNIMQSGANFLRGGAFKPRTSPYAFQGLEGSGIDLLLKCKKKYGIPIVTEIMGISDIPLFEDVDIIQVGARNMQNFRLLKELGHLKQPILLKRGLANTIEELLMSAEYIMSGGNENVILCERGIRTFETYTRNTFDLSAIPMIKRLSHLPVIADPSHAAGLDWLVEPLAKAAVAAGADGLMIEVHNDPSHALSDGKQSLTPSRFTEVMEVLKNYIKLEKKVIG
ncbi:3-deoxy-7-phosphoheptulonate synthase [Christensenella tenuis]|jgi:3-deoxy-7-phosphoheptulonate synthase|uniref:3-deoxy-7-phosphoheptulonate synthase n=1 Tax=Christensenella tenuis TaxID=2763033 RepID=A0ABR7EB48_9FIRM|nr:3-deoxy-7-phosphoheptulonate synthase [Christensenella tenuis]MBC5647013.1 3-deoxy-7-phosphoheptulonate synthase [Christensenella tenuis]